MVAGKQSHHPNGSLSNNNNAFEGYEIRSGMSVQDLKQLTAQRQCLEFWARNSPGQTPISSPSSTNSSSSPARYGTYQTYSYAPRRRGFASDKMFVTCGGQVVSFMEGVVNMPQTEYQMDN